MKKFFSLISMLVLTATAFAINNPTLTVKSDKYSTLGVIEVTCEEGCTISYKWDDATEYTATSSDDVTVTTEAMLIGDHTLYAIATKGTEESAVASQKITTYSPLDVLKLTELNDEMQVIFEKYYTNNMDEEMKCILTVPAAAAIVKTAFNHAYKVMMNENATEGQINRAVTALEIADAVAPRLQKAFQEETEYGYYRLLGMEISAAYVQYITILGAGIDTEYTINIEGYDPITTNSEGIANELHEAIKKADFTMFDEPDQTVQEFIKATEELGKAMKLADKEYVAILNAHINAEVDKQKAEKDAQKEQEIAEAKKAIDDAKAAINKAHTYVINCLEAAKKFLNSENRKAILEAVIMDVVFGIPGQIANVEEAINDYIQALVKGYFDDHTKQLVENIENETSTLNAMMTSDVTAISSANATTATTKKTVKVINNGKFLIQSNNVMYNAAGATVK